MVRGHVPIVRSFTFMLLLLILTACGSEELENQPTSEGSSAPDTGHYPIEAEGADGNAVEIIEEPDRIVSLMPSNTEIVFALEQGDALVGVTDIDDYPEEAEEIEAVGSGLGFDVERVLALEPDLVLDHASSGDASSEGIQQLENAGIDVLTVANPQSLEEAYGVIEDVGTVVNREAKAEAIVEDIESEVGDIQDVTGDLPEEEQKRVWIEVSSDPDLYTTGSHTFMDDMVTAVGARNAAEDSEGWVAYTEEEAVALDPDVIITTYGDEETIMEREGWQEVTAVQDEAVYRLDGDILSRPGPRIAEGLRTLARHIYEDEWPD
ncbi:ABC transporter substrate-binding protein [Salicibibacter kimchii]|uniref:ABC transporter substrate-binding protein n=1 Tax=Salicibibacter kimchii TaxID=2099786 RepID=A0A345BV70_9BACI|nr:ABC transporter substrate-binding protein [Salicibibacter kimchii]AXF54851.1 ABC transporter substrate-binding protein [Salicibibacter kimchii]